MLPAPLASHSQTSLISTQTCTLQHRTFSSASIMLKRGTHATNLKTTVRAAGSLFLYFLAAARVRAFLVCEVR